MAQQRRKFSGEEKVQILRKHLIEKIPVSEVCEAYGIKPTLFYRWQQELFEHGAAAFDRRGRSNGSSSQAEEKVEKLKKKLAHKDEVIAEIMSSHIELKKSLGED